MQRDAKILIVDDDQGVLYTAKMILKQHFAHVVTEGNPVAAFDMLKKESYDILILDMNFRRGATSGEEGLEWLKKTLEIQPGIQVIMDTAYGDIGLAVDSMKEGAVDFIAKPWDKEKLLSTVHNAYNLLQSRREIKSLKSRQEILLKDAGMEFSEMIGQDRSLRNIKKIIDKVAGTDANLLILGENGTGKELVARRVHKHSKRHNGPFIKIDLGAIPETLFESELFGHKKGAFTDAKEDRTGRIELAAEGTLFLDEIANLSLHLQAKLLSVLQQSSVSRVGSSETVPVNFRLISATNKDIQQEVAAGNFRQDLLYRINTVEITVPPLRERKKDIPLLINYYMAFYMSKYQKSGLSVSQETHEALMNYIWPGNIRELRHAVERAVILSERNILGLTDFIPASHLKFQDPQGSPDSARMEDLEKKAIMDALQNHAGNQSMAARSLGIGRTTLYRKMKKYNIIQ
jgi:two-component system, NtrC family, response regulator HydG